MIDFVVSAFSYWPAAIAIAVIFSALVFVHEWGHYAVARACGVRIEVFSIGFGWEVFGWNDNHGTRWKICIVPLGGYVKMFGDEDAASAGKRKDLTPQEEKDAFHNKPLWKKAAVVFAGPAINYIFAIVLLAGLYVISGKPSIPPNAAAVIVNSAAHKVGIKPHDKIISIDGNEIENFGDIQRTMLLSRGEEKTIEVLRDGTTLNFTVAPKVEKSEDELGFSNSRALLGIMGGDTAFKIDSITSVDGVEFNSKEDARAFLCNSLGNTVQVALGGQANNFIINALKKNNPDCMNANAIIVAGLDNTKPVKLGLPKAIGAAAKRTMEVNKTVLISFKQIFTGTRSATELGGIIRIGTVIAQMTDQGLPALIAITAFLSITLGLINLFPIPMLDGGHLLFYAIEAIIRRPVPEKVQDFAFQAGFIFIIGVMIFTNLNDIVQLLI